MSALDPFIQRFTLCSILLFCGAAHADVTESSFKRPTTFTPKFDAGKFCPKDGKASFAAYDTFFSGSSKDLSFYIWLKEREIGNRFARKHLPEEKVHYIQEASIKEPSAFVSVYAAYELLTLVRDRGLAEIVPSKLGDEALPEALLKSACLYVHSIIAEQLSGSLARLAYDWAELTEIVQRLDRLGFDRIRKTTAQDMARVWNQIPDGYPSFLRKKLQWYAFLRDLLPGIPTRAEWATVPKNYEEYRSFLEREISKVRELTTTLTFHYVQLEQFLNELPPEKERVKPLTPEDFEPTLPDHEWHQLLSDQYVRFIFSNKKLVRASVASLYEVIASGDEGMTYERLVPFFKLFGDLGYFHVLPGLFRIASWNWDSFPAWVKSTLSISGPMPDDDQERLDHWVQVRFYAIEIVHALLPNLMDEDVENVMIWMARSFSSVEEICAVRTCEPGSALGLLITQLKLKLDLVFSAVNQQVIERFRFSRGNHFSEALPNYEQSESVGVWAAFLARVTWPEVKALPSKLYREVADHPMAYATISFIPIAAPYSATARVLTKLLTQVFFATVAVLAVRTAADLLNPHGVLIFSNFRSTLQFSLHLGAFALPLVLVTKGVLSLRVAHELKYLQEAWLELRPAYQFLRLEVGASEKAVAIAVRKLRVYMHTDRAFGVNRIRILEFEAELLEAQAAILKHNKYFQKHFRTGVDNLFFAQWNWVQRIFKLNDLSAHPGAWREPLLLNP